MTRAVSWLRSAALIGAAGAVLSCSSGDVLVGGVTQPDMSSACGLACAVASCAGQPGATVVRGRVTAPNGADPIRQALVYVPRDGQVTPFGPQVACEVCGSGLTKDPIVQAITNTDGTFELHGVPATASTPVVIQKGRWRKVVHLPVTACQAQQLTAEQGRLPRDQTEGDLPRMAVAVGDYDAIECVLRDIGLAQREFTAPLQGGAVHLYDNEFAGKGAPGHVNVGELVKNLDRMLQYNLIFFNCARETYSEALLADPKVRANLAEYVSRGGRLYATDWSYDWIQQPEPFSPFICYYDAEPCSVQTPHSFASALGNGGDPTPFTAAVAQGTPAGQALSSWLTKLPQPLTGGQVPISDLLPDWVVIRQTALDTVRYPTTTWLTGPVYKIQRPLTVGFDYPVPQACGKVLYSSYHTRGHAGMTLFPDYCPKGGMIPQEHVLEYLIFEISSCVGTLG